MSEIGQEAASVLLLAMDVEAKIFCPLQTDVKQIKPKLVSEIKQCIQDGESVEWSVVLLSSVLNLQCVTNELHDQLQELLLHSYSNRWCMDGRAAYNLYHLWYAATQNDQKIMTPKVELFLALAVKSAFQNNKGIFHPFNFISIKSNLTFQGQQFLYGRRLTK
jgi:hypothetical protein